MGAATATPTVQQLRLAGQAAAPDGPIDLTGMLVMHRALRRDLDLFVAAVRRTPLDDRETWRGLAGRWELFCTILHHHHVAEDEGVWPVLLRRADEHDDSAARAVLDAMAAEHSEVDPLLESLTADFARLMARADGDARTRLEGRMVAARDRLGHHLGHEESDALALVQQYLSPAEWTHIEKNLAKPSSLRVMAASIGWVLHDLPEPVVTRALAGAPVFRLLWRLFLRSPFARRERRVFRYVDGPATRTEGRFH